MSKDIIKIESLGQGQYLVNGKRAWMETIGWRSHDALTYEEKIAFGDYLNELTPLNRIM